MPPTDRQIAIALPALMIYNFWAQHWTAGYITFCIIYLWTFLVLDARGYDDPELPTREAFLLKLQFVAAEDLSPEERECGVCYDERESYVRLPCGHIQCSSCVETVFAAGKLDNRCPYYRRELFRQAAPWDRIEIRLFLCSELLILIRDIILILQIVWGVVGRARSPATATDITKLVEIGESVYDRGGLLLCLAKHLYRKDMQVWERFDLAAATWSQWTMQVFTLVMVPWAIESLSYR